LGFTVSSQKTQSNILNTTVNNVLQLLLTYRIQLRAGSVGCSS
jgi:hypothetical protein